MERGNAPVRREPLVEIIACSVLDAVEAQRGGAGRLEIIRDLHRGGLTPSLELVRDILEAVTIPVRVMLRESEDYERAGSAERERLCIAAEKLSHLRVDGVVLGFMKNSEIDVQLTESILSCAPNLRATFHHAFDDAREPFAAIRVLKELSQVDRILTSGGAGDWPEKIARLSSYHEAAGPEIQMLAGGGMDQHSIAMICEASDVREFHVGRAARAPASANGVVWTELVKRMVEAARDC